MYTYAISSISVYDYFWLGCAWYNRKRNTQKTALFGLSWFVWPIYFSDITLIDNLVGVKSYVSNWNDNLRKREMIVKNVAFLLSMSIVHFVMFIFGDILCDITLTDNLTDQ